MKLCDILTEWEQSYDFHGRPEWEEGDWQEEIDYHTMKNPMPQTIADPENERVWDEFGDVADEFGEPPEKRYITSGVLPVDEIISIEVNLDPVHMEYIKTHGLKAGDVLVAKLHGRYLCLDGSHRLAYMHMTGIKRVRVKLYDYDRALADDRL